MTGDADAFVAGGSAFGLRVAAHGRADSGTAGDAEPLIEQSLFQRRQEQENVVLLARPAHQADAPDLSLDGAKAAGDFDSEFVEKLVANFLIFDALGDFHRAHGNQTVGGIGDEQLEPQGFEAGIQRLLVAALVAFCEPLKQMSILWRSTSSGTPASVATASTTRSAPSSSATFRKSSRRCMTPVEVSP